MRLKILASQSNLGLGFYTMGRLFVILDSVGCIVTKNFVLLLRILIH